MMPTMLLGTLSSPSPAGWSPASAFLRAKHSRPTTNNGGHEKPPLPNEKFVRGTVRRMLRPFSHLNLDIHSVVCKITVGPNLLLLCLLCLLCLLSRLCSNLVAQAFLAVAQPCLAAAQPFPAAAQPFAAVQPLSTVRRCLLAVFPRTLPSPPCVPLPREASPRLGVGLQGAQTPVWPGFFAAVGVAVGGRGEAGEVGWGRAAQGRWGDSGAGCAFRERPAVAPATLVFPVCLRRKVTEAAAE